MDTDEAAKSSPHVDASSILNKFMVGYQGWSSCPDDREESRSSGGWKHWFSRDPAEGGYPTFDFWPDISDYDESELYSVPSILPSRLRTGASGKLFSSNHPATVARHFRVLAAHRIDGVFLQRWANQCLVPESISGRPLNPASRLAMIARERDAVLNHVRRAAELSGRVWAVMYDLTAMEPAHIADTILSDWHHLLKDESIVESPSYLKHQGAIVLAIGGVGFAQTGQIPAMILWLIGQLRARTPGGVWLMLGVSTAWRAGGGEQDPSSGWQEVFSSADAICPWTVRRYRDEDDADLFFETVVREDARFLENKNVTLVPTVFPGFSLGNALRSDELNEIPRQGGKFLWRQLENAKKLNPPMIYAAMFDEFESGTALMPTVARSDLLPRSQFQFLSLDIDGVSDLPSDWYLRICGLASCALKDGHQDEGELPRKKLLVDYWHTRPKKSATTDGRAADPSSSAPSQSDTQASSHHQQVAQAFTAIPETNDTEPPPPPYSLTSPEGNPVPALVASSASEASFPARATASYPEPVSASPRSDAGSGPIAQLASTLGSVSLSAEPPSTEPVRTSSPQANSPGQSSEQQIYSYSYIPSGSWPNTAALNSANTQQPGISGWPQNGHPHPSHASTLPTSAFTPAWPAGEVTPNELPSTNVTPPTPGTAHPQDAAHSPHHHPYHANTLPAIPQGSPFSTWGPQQQPNASGASGSDGTHPSWQHPITTNTNQCGGTPPAAGSHWRPVGEAASYYENHPSLPGSSSPTPTTATTSSASSTQWPPNNHPAPHHANSWGPGFYYQPLQLHGPQDQGSSSPLLTTASTPQAAAITVSHAPYAPHHAYTIGPGVTTPTPIPELQQKWNIPSSAPAQTPAVESNAPPLPPRPLSGSTPLTSPSPTSPYTPPSQAQASYPQGSSPSSGSAAPTIIPQAGMKILTSINPDMAKKAENALRMGGQFYNKFTKR